MVTGDTAAIIYGEPRLTNGIDIVVDLERAQVRSLLSAFPAPDFYVPPEPAVIAEIERERHGHFNIVHRQSSLKADLYPVEDDPLYAWAMGHRRRITVGQEQVVVAPPEYVIVQKLQYCRTGGSDKHLHDIRAMLALPENQITEAVIRSDVERLGLEREWATASGGRPVS